MIHDLDKTLEKMIYQRGNINRTDIDITFDTPDREWSGRLSRPTLNCWAYDLRENMKLRSMERQVVRNGDTAAVLFPSIRMDVSYLVTAWARKMEDEHQLIWRALSALKRTPRIAPAEAEGMLRYQKRDLPLLVATPSDHPVNLPDLWGVLDNVMRLGFTLVVTVELDTALADYEAPVTKGMQIRTSSTTDNTPPESFNAARGGFTAADETTSES
ncbi:MAG: DUF4255 domain-containing protein [Anaerolineae bacterium]|jgi:hypothetical protein|nr:DUF4255 domain-containing protein [Anaerolineae bacterium]